MDSKENTVINTPIMIEKATQLVPVNLDANASVPPISEAKGVLLSVLEMQGNASSPHFLGRKLRNQMDVAREHVAYALGGEDKEVFFCSGASEGNRWLVDAVSQTGEARKQPFSVLVSPFEHPSLMKCLVSKAESGKIVLEKMRIVDGKLEIDPLRLKNAEILFVTAAHNETGYLPNLDEIAKSLPEETIFISDASQAVGRLEKLPERVDAIVASSHKMGGVVGAGAVLIRGRARKLNAPWSGGGQEAGLRPGSESVPLIAAMGEAARLVENTRKQAFELESLRDEVEAYLLNEWPFAFVVAGKSKRLPQTLAICLDGLDGEALRIVIDQARVCVGFGSACSALAPEPSQALLDFGFSAKQARATIRISLSAAESIESVWEGVTRLKMAVAGL